jgi:Tfp pilus assembly protein PilO
MAATWKKNYSKYRSFVVSNLSHYKQRSDLKAYLELFLSLATITIFSMFALRPTLLTIAKLVKEIEVNKSTIEIMSVKISNLRKVQNLYNQEKESIDILSSALPEGPKPDAFVRHVEGISEKTSITTSSMSMGEMALLLPAGVEKSINKSDVFPEGVKSFSYSVSSSSSYAQLFDFLTLLENIRRPVSIASVVIQPIKKGVAGSVSININGSVPFVPDGNLINLSSTMNKPTSLKKK